MVPRFIRRPVVARTLIILDQPRPEPRVMNLRRLGLLACVAALLAAPAMATNVQIDPKYNGVHIGGGPYTLLSNAGAGSGSVVSPVTGAAYEWCSTGTFGGATLALMALGPDGSTYMQVASQTSAGCTGVVIGHNAQLKVTVTGGTPSALYSNLS